jgi:hypothetical protein
MVAVDKIADNLYSVKPYGTYVVSGIASVTSGSIIVIAPSYPSGIP